MSRIDMYQITLSYDDRMAMDWIGARYFHGYDLSDCFMDCIEYQDCPDAFGDSWNDPINWELKVPEHIAWRIKEGIEDEDCELTCFADELKDKLLNFCASIV